MKGTAQPDSDLTKPNIWTAPLDLKKPEVGGDLAEHSYRSTGGLMPAELVWFVLDTQRGAGVSQQALADLAELSRPQLANALQGRFGLSPAAGGRLRDALVVLPRRLPDLFDLVPQEEASL